MNKIKLLFIFIIIFSCSKNTSNHFTDKEILKPELFLPGIVTSLETQEFGLTISPKDGKTIFSTRRIADEKQKIYETTYRNKKWSIPKIASFSTDRDESPHFSKNGNILYFGSERAIKNKPNKGNFDMNVWKTELKNNTWTSPTVLPEIINKVQIINEKWPSSNLSHFVTVDDKTFYTGTQLRGTKGIDIYKTTLSNKQFTPLEKLSPSINSEDLWEYAPVISYDGKYLFYQVYNKEDGFGGDDIYVSKKNKDNQWLTGKNLGNLINTNMNECPAEMSSDGKYFFFTRDYKKNPNEYDGISSIYFIETKALKLNELFK